LTTNEALKCIENDYGDLDDLMEEAVFDGICPAVCMTCGATYEMEPDQTKGWCCVCNANNVKSFMILLGVI
jgi:hypothetical protein